MTQFDNQGRPVVPGDARRRTLRAAGFAVDRHGPVTTRLLSAWKHYQAGGHPKKWNAANPKQTAPGQAPAGALGPTMSVRAAAQSVGKAATKGSRSVARGVGRGVAGAHAKAKVNQSRPRARAGGGGGGAGGGAGAGGGGGGAAPSNFPGVPGVDAGGTNTAHLIGRGMADTLAGYQYDPQIHELLTQLAQGQRDETQHQGDIGNWYGQVEGAQRTAGQRDTEAADHAHQVTTQALQGILQSLGGSRGAGVVGAAGLNDINAQAQQGSSQDRYNADLAPLLKQEEAGAHSRELALGSQRENAINQSLVGVRGQRGQARAKALMDIIQANNQGRQSNFQNKLAVQNAQLAGASLGLNADQTYAGIAAQKAGTKLNQQKLKLESLAMQQKTGAPNWQKLNYPDRQTVVHDAVGRAAATMAPDHWDDAYVRDQALKIIRAGGYNAARGKNYRGKVNRQSQRQIQLAVDQAARAAYQAWKAKGH